MRGLIIAALSAAVAISASASLTPTTAQAAPQYKSSKDKVVKGKTARRSVKQARVAEDRAPRRQRVAIVDQQTCGTYKFWKDGSCQDARNKPTPWKMF